MIFFEYQLKAKPQAVGTSQGFGFENKGTEALSFRQVYGCFFSGSRQVNALRGVCGINGVKRVVFIEEGAFWGIISVLLVTVGWFMGILGDHDCESTLFWLIFGLEVKSCV